MRVKARGFLDRALLLVVALTVCLVGGAAFWMAEDYHINPAWVFLAGNSILLIPLVAGDFRGMFRKPSFILFFVFWMVIHGLTVLSLMRWVSLAYWIPLLALELAVGYFIAYSFFDVPSSSD